MRLCCWLVTYGRERTRLGTSHAKEATGMPPGCYGLLTLAYRYGLIIHRQYYGMTALAGTASQTQHQRLQAFF